MAGFGYRPEIDGLRAIAVIPVILFHMGLSWIPGGYIGVDVFFVISGFLITSIIKKELDQGTFSFRDFWARRIRRILPAMVFMTACTLAATYVFVLRSEYQAIGKQALAALLSVANIYFWRTTGDYWGTAAEESPFLHTWSLSVEEQFYLFFPIAMWLVFRFRSRWLQGCILAAVIVSLALFLWGSQAYPTATFYLLPTRVWELGTGCLLAVSISNQSPKNSNFGVFAIAGLGMIVLSYRFFDIPNAGLGLAVVGTALIIAFGQVGLCNKLLSHRSVVHIGKISYSLYLWHWPVLVLSVPLGLSWPGFSDKVVLIGATYLLALGTYHLVEKPTRRRHAIVPPILVSGTLVASVALWMVLGQRYYDTTAYSEARYITFDCSPNQKGLEFPPRPYQLLNAPRFATTVIENPYYQPDAFFGEGIRIGNRSIAPEIVVIGDSHGCMWSDAIATVAREDGISAAFYCMRGVHPFVDISPSSNKDKQEITRFHHAKLSHIETWKPRLVIVGMVWEKNDIPAARAFVDFAKQQGSQVLLIEDPPRFPCGNVNAMQWLASKHIKPIAGERQFVTTKLDAPTEKERGVVRLLAESYDHVHFLPTYDLYSSDSGVLALDGRDVMYLDDDHLLQAGARKIIPRLRAEISKILPGQ